MANKNSNRVNNEEGYWQVIGSGYAVGDGDFQYVDINGIVDSGSYVLYLSADIVEAYYSEVPGADYSGDDKGMIFPCSAMLPDLILGFEDYDAVIPGPYLNLTHASEEDCKWSTVSLSNDNLTNLW